MVMAQRAERQSRGVAANAPYRAPSEHFIAPQARNRRAPATAPPARPYQYGQGRWSLLRGAVYYNTVNGKLAGLGKRSSGAVIGSRPVPPITRTISASVAASAAARADWFRSTRD